MNRQRLIPTWCVAFVAVMVGMTQVTLVRGAEAPTLCLAAPVPDKPIAPPPTPPHRRLGTPGSEKQFLSNKNRSTNSASP